MDFVAIDVETANASVASICQIGIATFKRGTLANEWKSYVDPQDHFDGMNVSIHGIDESVVAGSPTYGMLADTIHGALNGRVVVTHTAFDKVAASTRLPSPLAGEGRSALQPQKWVRGRAATPHPSVLVESLRRLSRKGRGRNDDAAVPVRPAALRPHFLTRQN
jgi:hypothetical protein